MASSTSKDVDSYSGFFDNFKNRPTGLHEKLLKKGVTDVYCCGLAFDYCVGSSACDAAELGFRTYLIDDLCRSVAAGSQAKMSAALNAANVTVIQSDALGACLHERHTSITEAMSVTLRAHRWKLRTQKSLKLARERSQRRGSLDFSQNPELHSGFNKASHKASQPAGSNPQSVAVPVSVADTEAPANDAGGTTGN